MGIVGLNCLEMKQIDFEDGLKELGMFNLEKRNLGVSKKIIYQLCKEVPYVRRI